MWKFGGRRACGLSADELEKAEMRECDKSYGQAWINYKEQVVKAKTIERLNGELAKKSKTISKSYKMAWAAYDKVGAC